MDFTNNGLNNFHQGILRCSGLRFIGYWLENEDLTTW